MGSNYVPLNLYALVRKQVCLTMNVLILGAGGLGCELLKNVSMMVIKKEIQVDKITIIDMDTVDLTNLNRQFMFTDGDIGLNKSEVAAKYISDRFKKAINVVPIVHDLTLLNKDFYQDFQLILSGLDSVEARRYVNQICIQIAYESQFSNIIPLIDGGLESLKGHVKLIIPGVTACWECSISTLPTQNTTKNPMGLEIGNVPLCTIATNPRSIEHVIEYVYIKALENTDKDNGNKKSYHLHENWDQDDNIVGELFHECAERAIRYNIPRDRLSIPYMLGVMKRIIPNVSTTNSMIAAECCMELYKVYNDLIDFEGDPKNFLMMNGNQGQFYYKFVYQRDPRCPVCSVLF